MDPSGAEFTMHHPNHHHPHYHYYQNGAPPSGPTPRCPALRASAAEQRNYQLPTITPSRGSVQYDPVHSRSGNRDMWQSRTRQNWQPAMISPYAQDTVMVGTFSGPTPSNQPNQPNQPQHPSHPPCPMPGITNTPPGSENYQPQGPPYHQFRAIMHPAPRLLSQPSYQNPGGLAGPNTGPYNPQQAPNRPMQGMNGGLPASPSMHSLPSTQVPVSRPPTNPMQMGQAGSYANENIGPGQQLPNLLPHILTSQDHPTPFPRQTPEPIAQSTGPAEESSSHQVSQSSPAPTSTAQQQRTNDQTTRMINNPVEIRRASNAAMTRARRAMPRFGPIEWLGGDNQVLFRRGDTSVMEFVENYPGAVSNGENPIGDRIFRGNTSGKRIASQKALQSLQSVEIADLPESERTCVICYNDFGVANPEGINEAPLRLPKCKHVFGDHCIKKWFQESDSCPYCRDKVPSELQPMPSRRGHPGFRFVNPYHSMAQHLAAYQAHDQSPPRERDAAESESAAQSGQSVGGNTADRSSQFLDTVATNSRSTTGNRRFENTHQLHSPRTPSGNAAYERRSPPVEYDRRRRSRHRVRITPPSSRPTVFGASTSNGMPQASVRSSRSSRSRSPLDHTNMRVNSSNRRSLTNSPEQYQWNGSPPPHSNPIGGTTASSPQGGSAYDSSTLSFQSRGIVPDNFFSELVSVNPDVIPANEHPSGLPQMRSNADVFVSNPAHADSNQFTSYQRS